MKKILSAALALAVALSLLPAAFAAGGTAYASTQAVEVDGKKVEFQMYALKDANGNPTNYVKLRDVAHVLNGTKAQFAVGYDGTISVTTGTAYTDVGGEMTTPYSGDRAYRDGSGAVKVNGQAASLESIILTDDAGGDYTYFKLRDLGSALGFTVDWSAERGVFIETGAVQSTGDSNLDLFQGAWKGSFQSNGETVSEEIVITGEQVEIVQSKPSTKVGFFAGTVSVQTNAANTNGGEPYPYVLKITLKERLNNNTYEMEPYEANSNFYITSADFTAGWFNKYSNTYRRMDPTDPNTLYAPIKSGIDEHESKKNNLNKYPVYAEYPQVPDLGAVFGIKRDRVSIHETTFSGGSMAVYYYKENDVIDWAKQAIDIREWAQRKEFSYSDGMLDNYFYMTFFKMDAYETLKDRYVELLKECGFEEVVGESWGGGYRTYYHGYGYSIYIDTLNELSISVSEL